ncbi:MAG: type I-E CRISPR-associated protein Cas5/CasD [Candidatus Sumerlaeota bacterium]|nr:type I-E CRISPR-associated protein Cas5/CasD [Candidatus Sumerlaeota bacterium]
MSANTLLLRLEGPMQAWGDQESKFVVRRSSEAPTKSGVLGLLCAAMGVSRPAARDTLPRLNALEMGVRIDASGVRWWDYHTVGGGVMMPTAEGKLKPGAILTRREYLCDASFLVALRGDAALIAELAQAMRHPRWTLYLGRKCCPMSRPPFVAEPSEHSSLLSALRSHPLQRRLKYDAIPESVDCILEWRPLSNEPRAPRDAEIWYDAPLSFEPPSHQARFVIRKTLMVGENGDIRVDEKAAQSGTPPPLRPRADYTNSQYRKKREQRMEMDAGLCVFCKAMATTVQHTTYRHAGGNEQVEELRSLCRLCHDAVTMLEYGAGMGLDRINPEEPQWREQIAEKRRQIIAFRSLERRRRRLAAEEVE